MHRFVWNTNQHNTLLCAVKISENEKKGQQLDTVNKNESRKKNPQNGIDLMNDLLYYDDNIIIWLVEWNDGQQIRIDEKKIASPSRYKRVWTNKNGIIKIWWILTMKSGRNKTAL